MADKLYEVILICPNGKRESLRSKVTIYNRPYRGCGAAFDFDKWIVLKTRMTHDKIFCWVVNSTDERLKKIPMLKIIIEWESGEKGFLYSSPKKYVLGKKCEIMGYEFTMGKISEKTNAYDAATILGQGEKVTCKI